MCVQIMGKYQQARFELYTFPCRDIDRGSGTLSHKQNTHKTSNFRSFYPVQHNFHINLDKNIIRTYA